MNSEKYLSSLCQFIDEEDVNSLFNLRTAKKTSDFSQEEFDSLKEQVDDLSRKIWQNDFSPQSFSLELNSALEKYPELHEWKEDLKCFAQHKKEVEAILSSLRAPSITEFVHRYFSAPPQKREVINNQFCYDSERNFNRRDSHRLRKYNQLGKKLSKSCPALLERFQSKFQVNKKLTKTKEVKVKDDSGGWGWGTYILVFFIIKACASAI